MVAKYKDLRIEGTPDECFTFYMFSKFEKHYELKMKKEIKRQQNNDFDILFNQLKKKFEED